MIAGLLTACTPSAKNIAQVQQDQQWAAAYRELRQQCSEGVAGTCRRYERKRESFEAYVLYNSVTVPGLATSGFVPAVSSVHPVSIGGMR